ncbi:hypothetical protein [Amycolatopsis umgeniensis]|uniref:hypothetical protein n=1 Tax=Amycolatopsis umgeniensis TaxID=336628 RepID=UPI001C8670F9|nr:hypothetical protein [Amycolatopsis umgeniensis]
MDQAQPRSLDPQGFLELRDGTVVRSGGGIHDPQLIGGGLESECFPGAAHPFKCWFEGRVVFEQGAVKVDGER